jgi:hypothetical protein
MRVRAPLPVVDSSQTLSGSFGCADVHRAGLLVAGFAGSLVEEPGLLKVLLYALAFLIAVGQVVAGMRDASIAGFLEERVRAEANPTQGSLSPRNH